MADGLDFNNQTFSAAPAALGYFYQCELALLEFLRRDDPALDLSIELLDDIAFEGAGLELLQAKYHVEPGNLTDGSPDLWKTLRVWSEGDAVQPDATLILVTTGNAADGSVAALLRDDAQRDPDTAHDRLVTQARTRTNRDLEKAFGAFLAIPEHRRRALVQRIVIADGQALISDLDDEFSRALRHAAPSDRRQALITRLREWWLGRAEVHLEEIARGSHTRISGQEIEDRIAYLRDQLARDNLPIDLEDVAAPTDDEVAQDQRAFVMQLRLIALSNARIRQAVHDHNRAYAQRARWVREDLVGMDELATYEARLKTEWERIWLPDTEVEEEVSEEKAREYGREVHRACGDAPVGPIRARVTAPYVMRGSLEMLSDELRVGWHPDWVSRMQEVLKSSAS